MNQIALHKRGRAFIYSRCFQRATLRKKPSDDSVTRINTEFINVVFLPASKL